jgi:hypothetical protein
MISVIQALIDPFIPRIVFGQTRLLKMIFYFGVLPLYINIIKLSYYLNFINLMNCIKITILLRF